MSGSRRIHLSEAKQAAEKPRPADTLKGHEFSRVTPRPTRAIGLLRVSKTVKSDIKQAKKIWLPWPAILCLFVFALLLRGLLKDYGALHLYRPIWNGAAVFGFLFYLKWRLRRNVWFWVTMIAILALHVLLVLFVPWTDKWVPALVTAGVDSLDLCLAFWILGIVEELAGAPKDDESEI